MELTLIIFIPLLNMYSLSALHGPFPVLGARNTSMNNSDYATVCMHVSSFIDTWLWARTIPGNIGLQNNCSLFCLMCISN